MTAPTTFRAVRGTQNTQPPAQPQNAVLQGLLRGHLPGRQPQQEQPGPSQEDAVDVLDLEPQTQAWDVLQPEPAAPAPKQAVQAPSRLSGPVRELQWQGPPIPAPVPTADHKRFYQAVQLQVAAKSSSACHGCLEPTLIQLAGRLNVNVAAQSVKCIWSSLKGLLHSRTQPCLV